jgi:hypothetical protein
MLIAIEVYYKYRCHWCHSLLTTETKGNTCCGEGSDEVFADKYDKIYVKENNGDWHAEND